MSDQLTLADVALRAKADYDAVYEAGKKAGGGGGSIGKPFVDTSKGVLNHEYLFMANRWIDQLDKFDLSNVTNAAYMFQNSNELITCPEIDTSKAARMLYMFYNCPYLVSIEGIDFSSCTNATQAVGNCRSLQTIVINGTIPCTIDFSPCVALSGVTIRDIINALTTDATGKTVTLSKTAVNASLTTEEWDALVATKTNWTIALA